MFRQKLFNRVYCAILIEVDVAAGRKTHELLRFICQSKQPLAEADGHDAVLLAMQNQ